MNEIGQILDRARSLKPRRDINLLFSGGEPTIAHTFLDSVGYRYFKLKGADGNTYLVRHDERSSTWELTLFRANTLADEG